MQLHHLPRFRVVTAPFQRPPVLLGGVLFFCLVPVAVPGQSVTFAGTQTTLPAGGLSNPCGVAVDSAGDVFIADTYNSRVVELPKTSTGYGPQTTLPTSGLTFPCGVAVDSVGDVFIADTDNARAVELPKTATGYGSQVTLPVPAYYLAFPLAVAVDSTGDVFIANADNFEVDELPKSSTGYGPLTVLPGFGSYFPGGVAVDSAGDVFIADAYNSQAVELPWTATGYGAPITLPFSGLHAPYGVALDATDNVFIADTDNSRVVELPKTKTGYGPQTTLPFIGLSGPFGVAADGTGDVFIADTGNSRVVELPTRFNFGDVCPGCRSQTATLNFNVNSDTTFGATDLTSPTGDFDLAFVNTCSGALPAGATCAVSVTFAPTTTGIRFGSLVIRDSSGHAICTTSIYGFGQGPTINFSAEGVQFNGDASPSGGSLELTDGGTNEVSTAFLTTPVNVQSFTTDFDFQLINAKADGFTFTIQNVGPDALAPGALGGDLGYAGIKHSVAVKFDLYQNPGDPSNDSTGLFVDGARPIGPSSIDLTGGKINLHGGDLLDAHLAYDGTTLTLTIIDLAKLVIWSYPFTIDIPGTVGGSTAYIGFTGASGGLTAIQQISDWQFTPED